MGWWYGLVVVPTFWHLSLPHWHPTLGPSLSWCFRLPPKSVCSVAFPSLVGEGRSGASRVWVGGWVSLGDLGRISVVFPRWYSTPLGRCHLGSTQHAVQPSVLSPVPVQSRICWRQAASWNEQEQATASFWGVAKVSGAQKSSKRTAPDPP